MTYQQLEEFFAYTGLPFGDDAESLRMLKKQLLLELKSSDSGLLLVGVRNYGYNDIIRLFDAEETSPGAWNPEKILGEFPVLEKVIDLKQVYRHFELPEELADHADYQKFRELEAQPRFNDFLTRLRESIKTDNLKTAAALTGFLELFSDDQQFLARNEARIVLHNKLDTILELLEKGMKIRKSAYSDYFIINDYYLLIHAVGADDGDFLFDQLHVSEKRIEKEKDPDLAELIYMKQLQLPFDEFVAAQLRENLAYYRKAAGGQRSGSDYRVGIAWFIIVVTVFCLKISRSCRSHTTYYPQARVSAPFYKAVSSTSTLQAL